MKRGSFSKFVVFIGLVGLTAAARTEASDSIRAPAASYVEEVNCPRFTPEDVILTPVRYSIGDHEIDPIKKRITFLESGRLVVVNVDPVLGTLSGKPVIVDGSGKAVSKSSRQPYGNGPEWAVSQRGFELYYQKIDILNRVYLAKAREVNGRWILESIPNALWWGLPFSSFNIEDPYPRLLYAYSPTKHSLFGVWRDDDGSNPAVEHVVDDVFFSDAVGGSPAWHVPHDRSGVIVIKDSQGQAQIARYYLDTAQVNMISQYPLGSVTVNMSGVAEAGPNQLVKNYFFAVTDASRIDVFAEYPGDNYVYVNTLDVPTTGPNRFIIDTEAFTRDGQPYVALITAPATTLDNDSSDVWVAPLLATSPCEFRKVSSDIIATRVDPQPLELDSGVYIYYREKDPVSGNYLLRKAATGL